MMKMLTKILATLTTAAMMAGTVAMLPASAADAPMKGDVDRNGIINSLDGIYVLRYYADTMLKKENPGDPLCTYDLEIADISDNGEINCLDAILILKYYAESLLCHDGNFPAIDEFFRDKISEASYSDYVEDAEDRVLDYNSER